MLYWKKQARRNSWQAAGIKLLTGQYPGYTAADFPAADISGF